MAECQGWPVGPGYPCCIARELRPFRPDYGTIGL